MASDPNAGVCLIRRVVIRNYKSIAACDVELGPLTFLVGPNGSGKSNFLDALRFVSDSLRYSLEHALRDRGGIAEVRRQSTAATDFAMRVDFRLPSGAEGHYAFRIDGLRTTFGVQEEECVVRDDPSSPTGSVQFFRASYGEVRDSSLSIEPPAVHDRLYLVNAAGAPPFRPVYDALSSMAFYNLNPEVIREIHAPDPGEFLARDGANLAGVLANLEGRNPPLKSRIEEYLAQVVPGISAVHVLSLGPRDTLAFDYYFESKPTTATFMSTSMSDGTLRALGILVALFQEQADGGSGLLLVGIEEPETALHPAASGVLVDAMREAAASRQVMVTSHSPDLLDSPSIADHEILAVLTEDGITKIGHLDEAGRSVLRDHLFTAGDLLRMDQLRPDSAARSMSPEDLVLFDSGAPA
jgi:predicted ATPase